MGSDYSKHKDRNPRDTVATIQAILASLGLSAEFTEANEAVDGTWANRLQISGAPLGTNGKGTSEQYASASAHAELMERLQNKTFGMSALLGGSFERHGFYSYPDERLSPAAEIVARHDEAIDGWFDSWGLGTDCERIGLLETFSRMCHRRDDGLLAEIPFADAFEGKVRWIPSAVLPLLYGSNGMAAGNTLEECLVQGLSEIFERYVKKCVLTCGITPPEIPRGELGGWSVANLIERIEEGGRHAVRVLDCSMGRGYPVVASVLIDRYMGTFGVSFGAHPSLAVAVERTITEAFQGRSLDEFAQINALGTLEQAAAPSNLVHTLRNGEGVYPASLLTGKPSWEYAAWGADEAATNAEMLAGMLGLLKREGRHVLVRDSSHLGFPSCHIIVPGMSEVTDFGTSFPSYIRARLRMWEAFDRFPRLSDGDRQALLWLESSEAARAVLWPLGRPVEGDDVLLQRVFGYLHFSHGELDEACSCFRTLAKTVHPLGAPYWLAIADYAAQRAAGLHHDEALELVGLLYDDAFVRMVARDTREPSGLLARKFPQMSCFECGSCAAGAAGACAGAAVQEVLARIDDAMARSTVSQDKLTGRLAGLLG